MVTIIPFVDEGLGNSSYLIDLGDGRGLVELGSLRAQVSGRPLASGT